MTGPDTARTPTAPYAPDLSGSGYATAERISDLGVGPYRRLRLNHAIRLTTLICAVLLPHAKPPLIAGHDGEAVPDQTKWSEPFELVSPLSINAVNGGGGNDSVNANAWWTDFSGLDRRFSVAN